MPRPKGSKNKVYKASHINIVSIKLSDELYSWLNTQPNKTQYIRGLIEKDMNERKTIKEED
jgi:hypothetical protein